MNGKRVLAMYDVRGKQDYIYRSNHIKEIVGASCIIRDVFVDYLYPAARKVRNENTPEYAGYAGDAADEAIYCYKKDGEEIEEFSAEAFEDRMKGRQYIGEVVYDGGGNFLVLYKDKETCIRVNRIFTKELMIHTYALKVLCTYIEDVDFEDYTGDNERLRERHRINEAQESVIYPVNSLPIVQVDYQTSRPLSVLQKKTYVKGSRPEKMSIESGAKYDKYWKEAKANPDTAGEKLLDRIVTEKGKESLLAVIYIDGNNMGKQVHECLRGKRSYRECVNELRRFSGRIQREYVEDRISAINDMLDEKYKDEEYRKRRTIIAAGDEITIICNARDALDVTKAYFKDMPGNHGSCAGIAVFHSHAPFADAYRIAEECCESGKHRMKEDKLERADFIDFHYCQSGIGISLETIRETEGAKLSRPWRIDEGSESGQFYYTVSMAREMGVLLKKAKRSNTKSLLEYAKDSPSRLLMELERINAHRDEPLDFTLGGRIDKEQMQKLLYDVILVFDLWFDKEEFDEQDKIEA